MREAQLRHFVGNSNAVDSDNETQLEKIHTHLSEGLRMKRGQMEHLFGKEHVGILLRLRLDVKRTETIRNQFRAVGNPSGDKNEHANSRNVAALRNHIRCQCKTR